MGENCFENIIDIVLSVSRALVLFSAALGAIISIFLGWKLYKDAMLSKVSGEADFGGMSFKLTAAGPGIFFAAFGMWLLVQLVNRPLEMEDSTSTKTTQYQIHSDNKFFLKTKSEDRVNQSDVKDHDFVITEESNPTAIKKESNCDCLLKTKHRVFFNEKPLTNKSLAFALDIAIREIRRAERGEPVGMDMKDINERMEALDTLIKAKDAVND